MELRRPLTAAAASSVLIALMFVPSASASDEVSAVPPQQPAASAPQQPENAQQPAGQREGDLHLAATGSIDTTPYVLGGTVFLAAGTALVLYARRRELQQEA